MATSFGNLRSIVEIEVIPENNECELILNNAASSVEADSQYFIAHIMTMEECERLRAAMERYMTR